jgi:hypothetical protein
MEDIDLIDILSLKEKDPNDFRRCYIYVKKYIENIKEFDFKNERVVDLKVLLDKFLQFASPIETEILSLIYNLNEYADNLVLSCYKHTFQEVPRDSDVTRNLYYQHLYSNFSTIYNKIDLFFRNQNDDLLDFDGTLNYNVSNKRKAISIIQDAIDLINSDVSLSEKSKKKIITYLSDSIQELNNPKTNWKNFLIKSTEVILVLGALSEIIGGVESGNNLINAKNKIEEANREIVKTSITLNYMNLNQTFNFSKELEIQNNQLKMIE